MFVQNQYTANLAQPRSLLNSHQILFLVRGWGLGRRLPHGRVGSGQETIAHYASLTRPLSGVLGLESIQEKPK